MSSIAATATRDTAPPFTATLASEWTKLVTVRSTWITLALAAILSIGITALVSWVTGWSWSEWTDADKALFDPVMNSMVGLMFASILFVVLGVSLVASEYGSGMARLTMTVTPRRERVLLAKVAVVAAVSLVAGLVITAATFLTAQAIFGAYDVPTVGLGDGDALRTVLSVGLTTPVFPILGVAMAFLFRSTAIAITAVLGLIFAPSFFGGLLPRRWQEDVLAYLPGSAADSVALSHLDPDNPMYLDPVLGGIVAIAWLVLAIGGAGVVLNRRDV
jgi:ABC-2 type transport system permease protein